MIALLGNDCCTSSKVARSGNVASTTRASKEASERCNPSTWPMVVGQNSQNTHAIFSFWNSISKQCSIRRRRTFQTSFQPAPQDTCTRRKSIIVTRLLLKNQTKQPHLTFLQCRQSTIACRWHVLHYFTLNMATKLQHKSSVPYNDPNGTSFFPPLLMHINENITHRSTTSQTNIGMITMQFSRSHGQPLQKPQEMQQMLRIFVCRSLVFHKHDAIYDICHFILLWTFPHKWDKTARYHDAVYDTW